MVHITKHHQPDANAIKTSGAQSVDRALVLLSLVGRHAGDGMALSELTAASGLNKPTVRRLMLALINGGMVDQCRRTLRYRPGPEAYLLGLRAAEHHGLIRTATRQVAHLARVTEDAACLSVRRGLHSLCLHREDGPYPIRTHALMPGAYHPLGVGAGSLAMLAALPDNEVEEILAANHATLDADFPLLPPQRLRELVAETRRQGHALNPGLVFRDSWGLGVALQWPDGSLAGALSLAAIESRMQEPRCSQELLPLLKQQAREIEAQLARDYAAHA
ncbi:IclR family transcriptional regulator [Halomonas urumqiensis]|uniref:Transcriptional regulator n=1 Tax=Halomonas urumqiensis TaxID=1684789 RepID=A0A2N7UMG7_9GAMM|nr:IclR family transcriptional regulator [Halomonas urumqiensis]PMR81624.1 transcriptional regulator [Halomonas urumqiensis]PTB02261.1 IclR family transcriptional regulator [Halomonas urumqiensis]GHE21728.1 transcriptional regulator [Halomonas urumqiensis]